MCDMLRPGTRVKIPGFGGRGRVVRYSKGDPHGSPFYIVDVGRHGSEKIPAHQVVKARPWAWDSRVGYGGEMRWGRGRDAELDH
jgi:hypothetical protein